MQKWEYRLLFIKANLKVGKDKEPFFSMSMDDAGIFLPEEYTLNWINNAGAAGWELFSVTPETAGGTTLGWRAWFRRPLP